LSREFIVWTALQLLEENGLAGMSLRRVAATLNTRSASLNVYIPNIGQLYGLTLDLALAAITPQKITMHFSASDSKDAGGFCKGSWGEETLPLILRYGDITTRFSPPKIDDFPGVVRTKLALHEKLIVRAISLPFDVVAGFEAVKVKKSGGAVVGPTRHLNVKRYSAGFSRVSPRNEERRV
jgi:hypothetical protein